VAKVPKEDPKGRSASGKRGSGEKSVVKGKKAEGVSSENSSLGRYIAKRNGDFGAQKIVKSGKEPKVSKSVPKPPPRSSVVKRRVEKKTRCRPPLSD
jgi:hypothetical protein